GKLASVFRTGTSAGIPSAQPRAYESVVARAIASATTDPSQRESSRRGSRERQRSKLRLIPRFEFLPGIRMALPADMLEGVRRGDAAETRADVVRKTGRQALHDPAAVRIADPGRIDNPARLDRRHVDPGPVRRVHRRTLLAARDDERL